MPTIITHAVTGYLATQIFCNKSIRRNLIFWSLVSPVIPDLDVITFACGFSHSLVFALIWAVLVRGIFLRNTR